MQSLFPHSHNSMGRSFDMTGERSGEKTWCFPKQRGKKIIGFCDFGLQWECTNTGLLNSNINIRLRMYEVIYKPTTLLSIQELQKK